MLLEEILKRKSVRSYKKRKIEEKLLKEVLEAGRLAPSAANKQPWKFIVIKNKATRKKLAVACKNQQFVEEAPVVIVACIASKAYKNMGGWYNSATLDIGITLDHMTLQAAHIDLGTCWIGAFYEEEVKKILNAPDDVRIAALLTLGYPEDPSAVEKNRKPLSEIVAYEKFS
jgi:nitroreductase